MANWDADYYLWGTYECDICRDYGLDDSQIIKKGLVVACKECAGKDEEITKLNEKKREEKKREEEKYKKEKIRRDAVLKCKNSIDTTNISFTTEEIDKALLDEYCRRVEDYGLVKHKIILDISESQAWSKEDFESKNLDAAIEHQVYFGSGNDDSVETWVSIYTYRRRLHEWVRSPQLLLESLRKKKYRLDDKVNLTFGGVSVRQED
ncbi:hypothetical protein [Paenibacillus dendritiformis]|uniref:hypothetical protein n=1 Tax=Paenibacillus dendritiformis TaxID=130049 RepID=UPI00387E113F